MMSGRRPVLSLLCNFLVLFAACVAAAAQDGDAAPVAEDATALRRSTIRGQVVDDQGKPIPGMIINLNSMDADNPNSQRVSTDVDGRFETRDLAAGSYFLFVQETKGFVRDSVADGDDRSQTVFRVGDDVTIRMRRGGVVTGTVVDANGAPVVLSIVRFYRVRDRDGRRLRDGVDIDSWIPFVFTDDRGVYRAYGLSPGGYLVSAGGYMKYSNAAAHLVDEVPTFYPSSTRDAATVVTVGFGDEIQGIDIRHRRVRGHFIRGTVEGVPTSRGQVYQEVYVTRAEDGGVVASDDAFDERSDSAFEVGGVPDGEYDVTARAYFGGETLESQPRRVSLRGADVANVKLTLERQASVAGTVTLEPRVDTPAEPCPKKESRTLAEVLVAAYAESSASATVGDAGHSSATAADGSFKVGSMRPGRYRIRADLPSDDWFVKSVGLKSASPKALDRDSIVVARGQNVSDVVVAIARGAAALSGKVVPAKDGDVVRSDLSIFLVPADPAEAENALRYWEVPVASDGAFSLSHVAPGVYRALVRVRTTDNADDANRQVAWTKEGRAKLRKEAEATGETIELAACERVVGRMVRYTGGAR